MLLKSGLKQNYAAATWYGFDKQEGLSTGNTAGTIWGVVMRKIHAGLEPKNFEKTVNSFFLKNDVCACHEVSDSTRMWQAQLSKSYLCAPEDSNGRTNRMLLYLIST